MGPAAGRVHPGRKWLPGAERIALQRNVGERQKAQDLGGRELLYAGRDGCLYALQFSDAPGLLPAHASGPECDFRWIARTGTVGCEQPGLPLGSVLRRLAGGTAAHALPVV